jgi:glycerol-3-phosphate O-acyltransferase
MERGLNIWHFSLSLLSHNIEAFIEGTRSRIGKLLQPKFGILKIILESILTGNRIKDCIIVPMSIGYDRVIESAGYVNELLGTPKEKESLLQLLSSVNILSVNKVFKVDF